MMQIEIHKNFGKSFAKLNSKQKQRVKEAIALFRQNPYNSQLDNHALHGKQKGRRAIAVGGGLRIIFVEENNNESVELLNVGTHNQVYE